MIIKVPKKVTNNRGGNPKNGKRKPATPAAGTRPKRWIKARIPKFVAAAFESIEMKLRVTDGLQKTTTAPRNAYAKVINS